MNSHVIDFLKQFGFDAVWIEAEHGPIDLGESARYDAGV